MTLHGTIAFEISFVGIIKHLVGVLTALVCKKATKFLQTTLRPALHISVKYNSCFVRNNIQIFGISVLSISIQFCVLEIGDTLNIETKLPFIISPNHIYSTLYQTLKGNIFHG